MGTVPIPPISALLKNTVLEIHEAAFLLTNRWPENLSYHEGEFPSWLGEKNAFLVPGKGGYCPKKLGQKYRKALSVLQELVSSGELPNLSLDLRLPCYGKSKTILVRTLHTVMLALSHDLSLSEKLSNGLKFKQIQEKKRRNSSKITIDRTIAQSIINKEIAITSIGICRHDLMKQFGSVVQSTDMELRSIRRAVAPLLKGSISPLPEVKKNGTFCFSLFKEVVNTVTLLTMHPIDQDQSDYLLEAEFINSILSSPILTMYLSDESDFLKLFARYFCSSKISKTLYHHEKLNLIPHTHRSQMTIGELKYLHTSLILDDLSFVPEDVGNKGISPEGRKILTDGLLETQKTLGSRIEPGRRSFVKKLLLKDSTPL